MKTILFSGAILLAAVVCSSGCLEVRAPESIQIGSGPPPQRIDSSQVPPTSTHEEARAELVKAYRQIRYLEGENARLRESRDKYKRKYKDIEDRYDD
jgi:hypothetical protein